MLWLCLASAGAGVIGTLLVLRNRDHNAWRKFTKDFMFFPRENKALASMMNKEQAGFVHTPGAPYRITTTCATCGKKL